MGLFEQWQEQASRERTQAEYDSFWKSYLESEKDNYERILENYTVVPTGTLSALACEFGMDGVTFTGFLDGINTSLKTSLDLDGLDNDSKIMLDIDFDKLYFNMLDAKADWLYNLPQWNGILSDERRKEITKEFRISKQAFSDKVGRNDPCPCGSGKKYKKCCGQ